MCVQKLSSRTPCCLLWCNDKLLPPTVHTHTQTPIFPWSPPSPPLWLSHSNAAVCRWRTQEMLSCNCVALSSCGEVAGGLPPACLRHTRITNWGERGVRGGVPLKCKITTAVQCSASLPHSFSEAAILWWNEYVFDGVWMCVRLSLRVCVCVRTCIYMSVCLIECRVELRRGMVRWRGVGRRVCVRVWLCVCVCEAGVINQS